MSTVAGRGPLGVLRELAEGERRVALVPETVARLRSSGLDVIVEAGAGAAAWLADSAYAAAGAVVVSRPQVYAGAGIIACVQPPPAAEAPALRAGQALVGLLEPALSPEAVRRWAAAGVTAISLDLLPRTLSRAQPMDALTSQSNIAGYRAAVLAAATYGGFFPMLTTAAGTNRPASVLVLGAGVAGLQAIGTARRLGAVVTAYDVRPGCRADAESVGARFLDPGLAHSGGGEGGYARELAADEQAAQQQLIAEQAARFDVVIATARVPGRRPPMLLSAAGVKAMRPGSVVLDLAAGELGGNVEGSVPDTTWVSEGGVTVIGAGNLPSAMAPAASAAYSRNIAALLEHLLRDGAPALGRAGEGSADEIAADEIAAQVVVTHAGRVVSPQLARTLDGGTT